MAVWADWPRSSLSSRCCLRNEFTPAQSPALAVSYCGPKPQAGRDSVRFGRPRLGHAGLLRAGLASPSRIPLRRGAPDDGAGLSGLHGHYLIGVHAKPEQCLNVPNRRKPKTLALHESLYR